MRTFVATRSLLVLMAIITPAVSLNGPDIDESSQSNIRHSRGRALYQHPSRHRTVAVSYQQLSASSSGHAGSTHQLTSTETNKSSDIASYNSIHQKAQNHHTNNSIDNKQSEYLKRNQSSGTQIGNGSGSGNGIRKVTVDGHVNTSSTSNLNGGWKNVDKSVLFMGERALNNNNNNKKSRQGNDKDLDDELGSILDDSGIDMGGNRSVLLPDQDNENVFEGARSGHVDIVTRFLRIVESQHTLGENCTAGTDLNLGEGVVDRYAQERFRIEAEVAVNRANMLTRLWKYADAGVMSEYLLHASVFSMVEFDDDIFAAGNCYDQHQYRDYWLFCPYAYKLPDGMILVKDLAVEYKYLSNTSEWFYIARKNAENVIKVFNQFSRGYNTYKSNESSHTERVPDEILSVRYEDGKWSKPYYDCGGGNIWMLTYTVPFFGFANNTYFFKGTSGIDIDLRRVDIDQCPLPEDSTQLNIFAASDKCKKRTTECVALPGLGFRRGSYICICRKGFYFPVTSAEWHYYNGTVIEEEYEKLIVGDQSQYGATGVYECVPCAEGCESCVDGRACVVSLNWVMRSVILALACIIICCLPFVVIFTWKYGSVKVVRAASPVLLRVIILGAFLIYLTTIVMYPQPSVYTCTLRIWLREIGFSLTYGALMLKTWRISVIFRVRSAKAVKITDMNLLKRLGIIIIIFTVFLVIRTLVAPPIVIIGRTADDLKAYLCQTDWWDHSFSILEVMFLIWGIRLCIVVRKAPSEFNESRFISMAIYNEFLLSVFLNISMLFLQKPANPDLLFIIFFCHTQLTVTLLLCLIFGSKAYMVFKGHDKSEESSGMMSKTQASKLLNKARTSNSQYTSTNSSEPGGTLHCLQSGTSHDQLVHDEFTRLCAHLKLLKERNLRLGNKDLASKITAMQEAAVRHEHEKQRTEKLEKRTHKNSTSTDNGSTLSPATLKIKRQSVSFAEESTSIDDPAAAARVAVLVDRSMDEAMMAETSLDAPNAQEGQSGTSAYGKSTGNDDGHGKSERVIKSGHAHTHDIVINLDDKVRYSEEVTV